jgi:hypothetical protein
MGVIFFHTARWRELFLSCKGVAMSEQTCGPEPRTVAHAHQSPLACIERRRSSEKHQVTTNRTDAEGAKEGAKREPDACHLLCVEVCAMLGEQLHNRPKVVEDCSMKWRALVLKKRR